LFIDYFGYFFQVQEHPENPGEETGNGAGASKDNTRLAAQVLASRIAIGGRSGIGSSLLSLVYLF